MQLFEALRKIQFGRRGPRGKGGLDWAGASYVTPEAGATVRGDPQSPSEAPLSSLSWCHLPAFQKGDEITKYVGS
jgi:hypothetical protein